MALLLPACSVAEGDSLRPSARLVAEGEARQDRAKQNSRPAQQNHRANRPNETGDAKNRNAGAERPASGRGSLARVARVVDGDTIEVILRGRTLDVRLIGIDTPETVHPSMPVECFGPAASRFTSSRLSGEDVRLEFDIERTDRYGRTLAYVWKDGSLFNRTLVMRGLATVSTYPPNDRYESRFIAAENRASGAERGLWGSCDAVDSASNDGSSPAPPTNKNGNCTSGYSPCLPPAPDYDCAGGEGDGPKYASGPIRVTGSDPYALDSDGDGLAC